VSDVLKTPRSAARSLWRTHNRNPGNFLTKKLIPWLTHYLSVVLTPRHDFVTYLAGVTGILPLPSRAVVALAGDWGTGTTSAYAVADQIRKLNPDVTIHLGDVYYSGTSSEYTDYFLNGAWPPGNQKTLALNANHEMYDGGNGYFDTALPALQQATSYFCLENEYWRILGLDSGYYARSVPLLELLLSGLIRLHADILSWLKDVVFPNPADKRPVILLTHHQLFSSYDTEYHHLGEDLASYLDRVLVWMWGHEHRFAAYGKFTPGGTRPVRGRCIGHGGMPVELGAKIERSDRPLIVVDERKKGAVDGVEIGFCGFASLAFDGPSLEITYLDEKGVVLLRETWTQSPSGTTGSIGFCSPSLTNPAGRTLTDLVT
jgi:hypothetical protein